MIDKKKIIEDVMTQFKSENPGVHNEVQHSKCARDTGFNLDAIESDLKTNGIKKVLGVAKQYWSAYYYNNVGSQTKLGAGEQNYAVEVNKLLEQRLHKEDVDKYKVSLLINVINEIVLYGFDLDSQIKHKGKGDK